MKNIVLEAKKGLFSSAYNGHDSFAAFEKAVHMQSTMGTVAAVTNVGSLIGINEMNSNLISR